MTTAGGWNAANYHAAAEQYEQYYFRTPHLGIHASLPSSACASAASFSWNPDEKYMKIYPDTRKAQSIGRGAQREASNFLNLRQSDKTSSSLRVSANHPQPLPTNFLFHICDLPPNIEATDNCLIRPRPVRFMSPWPSAIACASCLVRLLPLRVTIRRDAADGGKRKHVEAATLFGDESTLSTSKSILGNLLSVPTIAASPRYLERSGFPCVHAAFLTARRRRTHPASMQIPR